MNKEEIVDLKSLFLSKQTLRKRRKRDYYFYVEYGMNLFLFLVFAPFTNSFFVLGKIAERLTEPGLNKRDDGLE